MAKEKAPAMMFYGREFYSDEDVLVMDWQQEATYLRLLWNCWQEGSIPAEVPKLAAICRNTPVEKFELEVWPALCSLFVARDDGRLIHQKVESLREAKEGRRKACSDAGKLGNEIRYGRASSERSEYELGVARTCDESASSERSERESGVARKTLSSDFRVPISDCRENLNTNTCASDDARLSESSAELSVDSPYFDTLEPPALFPVPESRDPREERRQFEKQQAQWFESWWGIYWLKKSRKRARESFGRRVRTEARFQEIMNATRAQATEMLAREPHHRPHGTTWLNGERWLDEAAEPGKQTAAPRGVVSGGIQDAMRLLKERGDL